jgi:hypothetical protein
MYGRVEVDEIDNVVFKFGNQLMTCGVFTNSDATSVYVATALVVASTLPPAVMPSRAKIRLPKSFPAAPNV